MLKNLTKQNSSILGIEKTTFFSTIKRIMLLLNIFLRQKNTLENKKNNSLELFSLFNLKKINYST
jgi:hypothetical protein